MAIRIEAAYRLLAESMQEYVQRLSKQGVKKLGGGGYAMVFQHPTMPNVVVKMLNVGDPGYEAYLEYCQGKGKGNPYCPKILQTVYAKDVFEDDFTKNLRLIFMEKLKPLTKKDYDAFGNHCAKLMGTPDVWQDDGPSMFEWWSTWVCLGLQKDDKDLAALAKYLVKVHIKSNERLVFDVHGENIMKRGSQIVITDPFSD